MKHKTLYVVVTMLIAAGLACDLPGAATPDVTATFAVALTSAFATAQAAVGSPVPSVPSNTPVVAGTTQLAPASATPLTIPQATSVKPSDTPAPSNTPGVQGCSDDAQYVADVTIPDNTVLNPGQAFTKTWRLKNSGTCTWVGSYQFAFVADNQMNGPASVGVSGNIAPGSQYDVSVNLVAPNTPGTYKSSWRMKNATGQIFGSTPFVQIVVAAPTATFTNTSLPLTATLTATVTATATNTAVPAGPFTVNINASNNGQVYSDGTTGNGVNNVGDVASNKSLQGFITFSLAGIPAGSTITGARLDLSSHDMLGNAFALGALRVYQQNYGTVDASDYFTGSALNALIRFSSEAELSDPTKQAFDAPGLAILQTALASGQIQLRLQFKEQATNNDNADNVLRPTPKLIVTYTTP
jgi:Ig-like domain from next to BRCA1 gene